MRPDMESNVSVGYHYFGNIIILGDIFVRSKYFCYIEIKFKTGFDLIWGLI